MLSEQLRGNPLFRGTTPTMSQEQRRRRSSTPQRYLRALSDGELAWLLRRCGPDDGTAAMRAAGLRVPAGRRDAGVVLWRRAQMLSKDHARRLATVLVEPLTPLVVLALEGTPGPTMSEARARRRLQRLARSELPAAIRLAVAVLGECELELHWRDQMLKAIEAGALFAASSDPAEEDFFEDP